MRKRFYILFVARDENGELRKIHIPLHYVVVFLAGAILGMLTITGIAGSYTRMLTKVSRFNELRTEREQLRSRYAALEQTAEEQQLQVASLGSLANEVSALYGLKTEAPISETDGLNPQELQASLTQFDLLKKTALSGAATIGLSAGHRELVSAQDWMRLARAPNIWPVEGRLNDGFGQRIDPFNGEGAFHRGLDITAPYGQPVVATADAVVDFANWQTGYGKLVILEHGGGIATRYAHLSAFNVTQGQQVKRGDVIGYVGLSGRSTGPHLHYEVWVRGIPVNPHKYLRTTLARVRRLTD